VRPPTGRSTGRDAVHRRPPPLALQHSDGCFGALTGRSDAGGGLSARCAARSRRFEPCASGRARDVGRLGAARRRCAPRGRSGVRRRSGRRARGVGLHAPIRSRWPSASARLGRRLFAPRRKLLPRPPPVAAWPESERGLKEKVVGCLPDRKLAGAHFSKGTKGHAFFFRPRQ
jgi:hypothetical protein